MMKGFKNILVSVLLAMIFCSVGAQNPKMDELKHKVNEAATDSARLYALTSLMYYAIDFTELYDSCFLQIKELAEKVPASRNKIDAYVQIANYYVVKNEFAEARHYLDASMNMADGLSQGKEIAKARVQVAFARYYEAIADDEKSLQNALEAIPVLEANLENNSTLLNAYLLASITFMRTGQKDKVKMYTENVLKEAVRLNDSYNLAYGYISYANCMIIDEPEVCTEYLDKALKVGLENKYVDIIGMAYDIYSIYEEAVTKDTLKSIGYLLKEVEVFNHKNYYRKLVGAINNLCYMYEINKELDKAYPYMLRGLALSDSLNFTEGKKNFHNLIGNYYTEKGRYKEAISHFHTYAWLRDTLYNEETKKQVNLLNARFETTQREAKIREMEDQELIQQGKIRQRNILLAGAVCVIIFILSGIILYRRYVHQKSLIAAERIKQLEQEKQLVATQAVLDGETAERTRLARDLHDGLGGMLSVVKLKLYDMKKGVSIESEDVARFENAIGLLDESIGELRRVAHNMMPDSLTRYGLKVALTDFCNAIPAAEFHYFGDNSRLDAKLEVMIYRTAHELINNALKHAAAEHIIVQIVQEPDRVALTVQDDGRGFDPSAQTNGTGLNNIRNRVGSYNGRMDIRSAVGQGTEISLEFKL